MEQRIERLEKYEDQFKPKKYDIKAIVGDELWKKHLKNLDDIINMMNAVQRTSVEIQEILKKMFNLTLSNYGYI